MRRTSPADHPIRPRLSPGPRPGSPFERAVARVVRGIPAGTTLGYGEVAARAGKPGAARLVVRALHRLDGLPWWRVARKDGTLAPMVAFEQAQLLRAERWRGPPAEAGPPRARGGAARTGPRTTGPGTTGRRTTGPRTTGPRTGRGRP